jgi:hypothetical protein
VTRASKRTASIPIPRSHAAVGTLGNGQIIVAGGGPVPATADVERYTPSTNKWQRLTPLPKASIPTGAVLGGDTFFVIGGFIGKLQASNLVEATIVP